MLVNLLNEKDLNDYLADIVYHGQDMEVFKSGDFKSPGFVEQNKDAIVRSMLMQWCKHRLHSYLAKDLPEHKEFLKLVTVDEPSLPAWAERCLSQGNTVHRFEADKIPATLTENISKIRDYLYSVAESYVNKTLARVKDTNAKSKEQISPKLRIDYLKTQEAYDTFTKTLEEAEKWHNIMAQKTELRKRNEKMYQASLAGTHNVMKWDDGMEIVQLTTPEALDYESEYMGHCVGKGSYDMGVKTGTIKIYSLRDAYGLPHATLEVRINKDTKKEEIHQCKGKGNKTPVEKYKSYIQEFITNEDFDIASDASNIGLIKVYDNKTRKSQYHDINEFINKLGTLPKNREYVIKGDLSLFHMNLIKLPDLSNFTIEGNFNCIGNFLTSLKGAPKKVSGNFNCSNNKLTSLEGAPQEIGGNFDCSYNLITTLKGAPKKVGFDFCCNDNQLISLKYSPTEIGGDFYCASNDNLTSFLGISKCKMPYQHIGCDFDLSAKYGISARMFTYEKLLDNDIYKSECVRLNLLQREHVK
ncbi:MAG: PcfJ domain-containing protein [Alphaproteobacteria bacterium]|nr:PcfJ domain-containing protein [Alphaproteobacteria bacterium]